MDSAAFVRDLEAYRDDRLTGLSAGGRDKVKESAEATDPEKLLRIALANEIGVSDLAASYAARTEEVDIKVAFARQAGDEARHFELVGGRLKALGLDPERLAPAGPNPLLEYLRDLPGPVERVAGGLFTLEAIAHAVNERFIQVAALRGDQETVRIYRDFIQPDEEAHAALGKTLLIRHARTDEAQARARAVVARTLDLAQEQRARAAERLGTRSFPGC